MGDVDEVLTVDEALLEADILFGVAGSFPAATTGPATAGRQACPCAAWRTELKAVACSRGVLSIVK